jgi:hypothetical protein
MWKGNERHCHGSFNGKQGATRMFYGNAERQQRFDDIKHRRMRLVPDERAATGGLLHQGDARRRWSVACLGNCSVKSVRADQLQ